MRRRARLRRDDEEIADCILLKVDALLGKGATEEATKVLARIPPGPYESPNYDYLIARAYYELGEPEKAAPLIEEAVKAPRCTPTPATTSASSATSAATTRGRPTRSCTPARSTCRAAARVVPLAGGLRRDRAPGRRQARPHARQVHPRGGGLLLRRRGAELVVDGVDPRALVILDSDPGETDRGAPRAARIFVYQRSVERAAGALDAIDEEVTHALEHEIAAIFTDRQKTEKDQLN